MARPSSSYDAARISPQDAEWLLAAYQQLLEAAVRAPSLRIGEFEELSGPNGQRFFVDLDTTDSVWPCEWIYREFECHATLDPEAPAIVCEGDIGRRCPVLTACAHLIR